MVGIGVGGGSRKSGEEEAGGLGRRHNWLESQRKNRTTPSDKRKICLNETRGAE